MCPCAAVWTARLLQDADEKVRLAACSVIDGTDYEVVKHDVSRRALGALADRLSDRKVSRRGALAKCASESLTPLPRLSGASPSRGIPDTRPAVQLGVRRHVSISVHSRTPGPICRKLTFRCRPSLAAMEETRLRMTSSVGSRLAWSTCSRPATVKLARELTFSSCAAARLGRLTADASSSALQRTLVLQTLSDHILPLPDEKDVEDTVSWTDRFLLVESSLQTVQQRNALMSVTHLSDKLENGVWTNYLSACQKYNVSSQRGLVWSDESTAHFFALRQGGLVDDKDTGRVLKEYLKRSIDTMSSQLAPT